MDCQKECCGKVTLVEVLYLWNMVKCWRVRISAFIFQICRVGMHIPGHLYTANLAAVICFRWLLVLSFQKSFGTLFQKKLVLCFRALLVVNFLEEFWYLQQFDRKFVTFLEKFWYFVQKTIGILFQRTFGTLFQRTLVFCFRGLRYFVSATIHTLFQTNFGTLFQKLLLHCFKCLFGTLFQRTFATFDKNNQGTVNAYELRSIVATLGTITVQYCYCCWFS